VRLSRQESSRAEFTRKMELLRKEFECGVNGVIQTTKLSKHSVVVISTQKNKQLLIPGEIKSCPK
jgi:hypothetical protein